jgi:hypothetical protein
LLNTRPLKTIEVITIADIDGNWTASDIRARNNQTGHRLMTHDPRITPMYQIVSRAVMRRGSVVELT